MTRMTYEETMVWGAAQYADVLDVLRHSGLTGEFTQTGGMCAALIVTLEAGFHLLITDEEDTLSWERDQHAGWYVGLYPPEEGAQPIRFAETPDSDVSALMALVDEVMRNHD